MRIISWLRCVYTAAAFFTCASPANSLCCPLPLSDTSLADYVTAWEDSLPRAGSNGFIQPLPEEMNSFGFALEQLFAGNVGPACTQFDELNYELQILTDSATDRPYFIAQERTCGLSGGGMYVVDPEYERNLVLEVPHPLYDIDTPEQGVTLATALGARAIFLAGVHRCANTQPSPCSGKTTVCDGVPGPYRISDASHFTQSYFQTAHEVSLGLSPVATAIQIHGQTTEPVTVEVSDGTKAPQRRNATVNSLRFALAQRGVSVGSCNWTPDRPESLNRCGTNNTQGRLTNGSADICGADALIGTGLFLHLDQKRSIRRDPTPLIAALKQVFPVDCPEAP